MKKGKSPTNHYLESELPLDTPLNPGIIIFNQPRQIELYEQTNYDATRSSEDEQKQGPF
ncbi:hypothetical protein JOD43_004365 [Pullulanibacillus pueri]|uniref:Uncharacterized protein n=1 Tax=Pullulanibacillus pueri TaxID=1437324 RepID=A0A8J3A0A4_9BACL|nr:hypothetical protein [Pullulanibacillus pueri]MBM7684152.1 hypothetical protein [Pullulanibacillus pueri]GGH88884.1 hypothetical protein GCM10007096_42230 [Pullulanibacillus pueri]